MENKGKFRVEMGIDFLSFTLHTGSLPRAFKVLRDTPESLKPCDVGLYGYKFSYNCPGVKVLYSPDRPEVHIQLSSLACRYYGSKLLEMVPKDASVSRCDLRCDVFNGYLSVDDIWGYLRRGNYCSTSRTITFVSKLESDEYAGATVYIGSVSSDVRLRVYDKGHEQQTTKDPLQWVRYEFQFRDDAARFFFSGCQETNESEMFYRAIHRFVRLTEGSRKDVSATHANRLKTLSQWVETFGERMGRVFYRPFARSPKFHTMMTYLKNTGSMLNVLRKARPDFEDVLHSFADLAEGRLRDHHEALIYELANPVSMGIQVV